MTANKDVLSLWQAERKQQAAENSNKLRKANIRVHELETELLKLQKDNSLLLNKLMRWKRFYERALAALRANDELNDQVSRLTAENAQLKEEISAVREWAKE